MLDVLCFCCIITRNHRSRSSTVSVLTHAFVGIEIILSTRMTIELEGSWQLLSSWTDCSSFKFQSANRSQVPQQSNNSSRTDDDASS